MEKKEILFIDDDGNLLDSMKRMLRNENDAWDMYFVTGINGVSDLLDYPNLQAVILDVNMPGKNGLELLQEIKAHPDTCDVEVIVVTGMSDNTLKRKALASGAVELLNKPLIKEDLIARLNSALKIKSYRDKLQSKNALLEQELVESQKMEVVGFLSKGMAHAFQNILNAIKVYSANYKGNGNDGLDSQKKIAAACEYGHKLVNQIINFSKRSSDSFIQCNLGEIVTNTLALFVPTLSGNVKIDWQLPQNIFVLKANQNQIQQMLMNLYINSVQFIKEHGHIKISILKPNAVPQLISNHSESYLQLQIVSRNVEKGLVTKIKENESSFTFDLFVIKRIVNNHNGNIVVETSGTQMLTINIYFPCMVAGESATKIKRADKKITSVVSNDYREE